MNFKVSIIVPAFNEENQIKPLLQSLINQNFRYNYEIIIVDNQSTDNTVKIVENFKIKHNIKDLKIITSKGKLGKVRNDGIFNSSGEWIAFIDADEIADPNWLSEKNHYLKTLLVNFLNLSAPMNWSSTMHRLMLDLLITKCACLNTNTL